jgi:ribonuclease H, mammalian HI/archaeal HII subfamily
LACGIDEAGRGPLIGPMVIAKVCGESEKLKEIGVKDSKLLSQNRREEIFNKLEEHSEKIDYIIIPPETIDKYVLKGELNLMEARYISLLIEKEGSYIVDCPDTNEVRFQDLLISLSGNHNITAKHKADLIYPEVGAASIVAKVIREKEIEKIKEEIGEFGSGYPSDERTIRFISEYYSKNKVLPPHVRKSWRTLKRIINLDNIEL